ncbi:DUF1937 family protein, partial [bacterium]|nr:DUF1937 family protein [bacterium]
MKRKIKINKIMAHLLGKDIKCIYPISSSAEIAKYMINATTFEHWAELDYLYIKNSEAVLVADMEGWKES